MIVDPSTGRTQRHTDLLNTLVDWTSQPRICDAMKRAGLANDEGVLALACRLQATLTRIQGVPWLGEIEAAQMTLGFLAHADVRRVIAKSVHENYGEAFRLAVRQLNELGDELEKEVLAARPGVRTQ